MVTKILISKLYLLNAAAANLLYASLSPKMPPASQDFTLIFDWKVLSATFVCNCDTALLPAEKLRSASTEEARCFQRLFL